MQKFSPPTSLCLTVALFLGHAFAQQTPAASSSGTGQAASAPTLKTRPPLTTQKDKFSYALGMSLGNNLKRESVPVDPDILEQGLKDTLAGQPAMTDEDARTALTEVQNQVRKEQQEKMQAMGEQNKKEGTEFLAANKTKEGVVALPSGLQYKILKAGTGAKPAATDTVTVNYRGTLINGTEFDSSYKRGEPASFPVNGVIKGWTEALQLMPVGSKWQLWIPSDLAYGERGAPGGAIGPNATLIFEVELLSVGGKDQPKQ